MPRHAAFFFAAALLASCAPPPEPTAPPPPAPPAPRAPDPAPPALRLPSAARPVREAIDLRIDPRAPTFSGEVTIDLTIAEPTRVVWLNATELTLKDASVTIAGARRPARVITGGEDFAGFVFDEPLPQGEAQLVIHYEGPLDAEKSRGLYRQAEGDGPDDAYVYSFFEPLDARRAFPCFDEPNYKIPWKITLRVDKKHVALANSPVASESPGEGGVKVVSFAETKPLPSYLVALVVGPFDVVEAGTAGRHGTPLRFIVPRGRGGETRYAASVTPKIITLLEDYFGVPYPYGKLDVAVVPRFWGTMEHPGLVALGQPLTLIKPSEETPQRKLRYANIAAHELAHYWFGDYVTMAWWDDTWLNEAMAEWMDAKITDGVDPSFGFPLTRIGEKAGAMRADGLPSAKKVRQPVASKHDIEDAFDGESTYVKGASIATMFESWLGPETFQRGVRRYMKEHAFGNATTDDLLGALDAESGKKVGAAYRTFLDQPGLPEIRAEIACPAGAPPRLALSQKRYVPIGSTAPEGISYSVPVCVRYGIKGAATGEVCHLLTERSATVDLPPATKCPTWVMPNRRGAGYYHARLGKGALGKLFGEARAALDDAERLTLVHDLDANVASGALPLGDALALLPAIAGGNRHEVAASFTLLRAMRRDLLPEALRPKLARFLQKTYGARAKALGFAPKPGEGDDARFLRPMLLGAMVSVGEDAALRAEGQALALKWLDDPKAVDPSVVDLAFFAASRSKDRAIWERIRTSAKASRSREVRAQLLGALGRFPDPALARESLALVLGGDFDLRESIAIFDSAFEEVETREIAYAWLKQSFDALTAKMRSDEAVGLFNYPASFCDEKHRADTAAFFGPRAEKVEGAPRVLTAALDRIAVCIAQDRAHRASIEALLRRP
jgi:aminopeptidase N